MNTCDYKIRCQTQKREASKDLWTRATKLSNSRNGTSMKWICTILGITGHVVDRSSPVQDIRIWMDEHCSKSYHIYRPILFGTGVQ